VGPSALRPGKRREMDPTNNIIKPTSPRVYLVLLHGMFLVLYGVHLTSPMTRVQAGLSLVLATLTLMLVTLPRAQLDTAWFVGLLTLGNTSVLMAIAENGTSPDLGIRRATPCYAIRRDSFKAV
jgi:hypothetical protein